MPLAPISFHGFAGVCPIDGDPRNIQAVLTEGYETYLICFQNDEPRIIQVNPEQDGLTEIRRISDQRNMPYAIFRVSLVP